jgi:hypothetical protein
VVVFWLCLLIGANLLLAVWWSAPPSSDSRTTARDFPREITLLAELDPAKLSAKPEMSAAGAERVERDDPAGNDAIAPSGQALVCRVWGPIGEPAVLEDLRSRVAASGDVVDVRESQVSSAPDFLVYIDTDQNIDNARRLTKELDAQRIDAHIIAGGDLVNSVSVGVFSAESRAQAQQQRLSELGYRSAIEPLSRAQTVYHLYGRVPEGFATAGHPFTDCTAIASIQ